MINNLKEKYFNNLTSFKKIAVLLVMFYIIIQVFKASNPFVIVEYGTVGVVSRFGKVNRLVSPGLNIRIPLVEKVNFYNTQKVIYQTNENPNLSGLNTMNEKSRLDISSSPVVKSNIDFADVPVDTTTKDGQQVSIRFTLRYSLNPERILWIAQNVGTQEQVLTRIVEADARAITRNIAREFPAQELYTGDVFNYQNRVADMLKQSFEKNGVILDDFLVRQIKFSDGYTAAVEQKQIEQEKVKAEEFKVQQEEFIKQQKITIAEGQAKAQEILKATIDPLVLQKMAIEKWNGILPTVMGSESPIPFIQTR